MDEIVFNTKSIHPTTEPSTGGRRSFSGRKSNFDFTRRERTISEKKRKELEEVYSKVVVHDFGDDYHLSEEEKQKKNKYYEVFARLKKCKRKFRKLDEYVKVYRLCMDALQVVAEGNGIYDPEKFMRMAVRGDIEVYGLTFPKYTGKNRKDINWNYVNEYIVYPEKDVNDLVKSKDDDIDDDEEDIVERLFEEDELLSIQQAIEHDDDEDIFMPYDEDDNDGDRDDVAVIASNKETKELTKNAPEVVRAIKEATREAKRRSNRDNRLNSYVFNMTEDDFEYIARLDNKRGFDSDSDIPVFHGDIMNRGDYKRYMFALENYERQQIKRNYNGKMRTQEEIDEIELLDALESAGWNVRALYNQKEKEKKLKKAYKKDKKREEELKKRLLAVQSRNKKRKSKVEFDSKKKDKKKKKKKKKSKESD